MQNLENDGLPSVAGRFLPCSHVDFERACRVMIAEEQEKPLPDNALINLLCNAVRLSREYIDYAENMNKTVLS